MQLAGYTLKDILYHGGGTVVASARSPEGEPVVIKYPETEHPGPELAARWRHEFAMLQQLQSERVIRALALREEGDRPVLVLEDFGNANLAQLIASQPLDLGERLSLAVQLSQALSDVHQQRLIHGDIAPKNVLVDLSRLRIKLCDFALSTRLDHEQAQQPESYLRGTLDYISPEQTGRTNLEVDYRSDFYSLGVSLYELFSGRRPFQLSDPIALLHAQIALSPTPLHRLDPRIPEPLSALVHKLLAKVPDARYQSSFGLLHDLQHCAEAWAREGRIEPFELGRADVPERFCIAQKLYGREAESAALLAAFERACAGAVELVLVSGYSGIGKTALVAELHRPALARRAYFARGKCDQYSRNEPYAALIQAFQPLMQQLAVESPERRLRWRESLLAALGEQAGAVAAIVPQLSLLTGPLPPLLPLPAAENEQRFHLAFARFVRCLASSAHPLLLFLDDLQWADPPSLKLLQQLLQDAREHGLETAEPAARSCLLLIGAYRDNEIAADHALHQLAGPCADNHAAPAHQLALQPLSLDHVQALVADTLQAQPQAVAPLAALCMEKTRGNPFFLTQFLRSLHQQGDLHYVREAGSWHWDLALIRQRAMTDNVVSLMLARLRELPPPAQSLLALASHLGAYQGEGFALRELMAVSGQGATECAAQLWPALESGLLLPLDEGYKFEHSPALLEAARYRFLHDRVQQAAHDLTPAELRAALQLQCGRRLLAACDAQALEERLFTVLDCLNQGSALIDDAAERERLLTLNLRGGQRALAASAHAMAVQLLRQARALMAPDAWTQAPARSLELLKTLAEAEYLAGHFEAAEALYPEALAACQDRLGQVELCLVQVDQYHIQGRFNDSYPVLCQALARLGHPMAETEDQAMAAVPAEFAATEQMLDAQGREAVLTAPEMAQAEQLLAMRLYYRLTHSTYQTRRFGAFVLTACRMVQTTLRHGQGDLACIGHVAYMTAMSAMGQPYPACFAMGRLAMAMAEGRDSPYFRTTVYQYFPAFYQHWGEPLSSTLAAMDRGLELGQRGINPLSAGFCALLGPINRFLMGEPLPGLEALCQQHLRFLQRTHQPGTEAMLRHGVLQPLLALRGLSLSAHSFDCEGSPSSALFDAPESAPPSIVQAFYSTAMLRHAYLLGDAERWRRHAGQEAAIKLCLPDSPSWVEACFFIALGLLRQDFVPEDERDAALSQARELLERFERWAEGCEANFRHKQALIAAELARVQGRLQEAMAAYAQAISAAEAAGFLAHAALAQERYADFWQAQGQPQLATQFLREAHGLYRRWGASLKCRQLEAAWPQLGLGLGRQARASRSSGSSSLGVSPSERSPEQELNHEASSKSPSSYGGRLDLHALLKAHQLLSQEVQLDALLPQMLAVLLQHAGAEHGAIVSHEDDQLIVEVMGGLREGGAAADAVAGGLAPSPLFCEHLGLPLAELGDAGSARLPSSLIEYTKLSRRSLVLNQLGRDERFAHCPYLQAQAPKSALCLPVITQGRLVALVYLENRQLENAFTTRHQQTLELLSSQAAIALVNAKMFEELEAKVERRTQELRLMSMKDGLTGIANRRAFDERLLVEWRRSQRQQLPLSLLMVDIDHFKQFNDHYGHLEGDRCIRAVALTLQQVAGRASDLVARYGGEEFALLLPETDAAAAARLAQSCLDAMAALGLPHAQSSAGGHVSLSIGCATVQASADTPPELLLGLADQALYRAKREGRRRWCQAAGEATEADLGS
ncbi:MAG: hypothetical protein CFE41_13225 [Burkholderiales bacterium PBB2]|nr:MAG: hypothetical protein CFE41_13225 [Burkholderiales bacterium PBB2]